MAKKASHVMGTAAGHIDNMVDRAMNPVIHIDSAAVEFNKSFHAMTVGMNINEKELGTKPPYGPMPTASCCEPSSRAS